MRAEYGGGKQAQGKIVKTTIFKILCYTCEFTIYIYIQYTAAQLIM